MADVTVNLEAVEGSSTAWSIVREKGSVTCSISEKDMIQALIAKARAGKVSAAGNPSVYTFTKFGNVKIAVTATLVK